MLYSSDHGEMLGEYNVWNEFVFYEPWVSVRLIVRAPGLMTLDAGCHTPFSQVQLLATLCLPGLLESR